MQNAREKAVPKPRIFYGWYLVAASWAMTFILGATSVGVFFKPMLDEFGWDRATLSLVSSVIMLVFAALYPLLGRLIDRLGARIMISVCVSSQILSNVINGLAANLLQIYIGRLFWELKPVHGVQVLINRWFVKNRGRALGILSTGTPLGTLLMVPLSQYLITIWGWRETLFFWAGISALVFIPLTFMIRNKPEDKGLLPDGEEVKSALPPSLTAQTEERAAPLPVAGDTGNTLKEVSKKGSFWLLSLTQLFCGISCGLLMTHTIVFATDLGYSELIGATFMSVQGGVSLLGVLVTGQLSDRMARNKVLAFTHAIRGISFVTLVSAVFAGGGSVWILYLAMAFFGFGWFTTAPLAAGLVPDLFGYLRMGTILGVTLSAHTIGSAIGVYTGGITYQLTGSYLAIFVVTGALEFLAAVFALYIRKR